jgi:hypothetical protein
MLRGLAGTDWAAPREDVVIANPPDSQAGPSPASSSSVDGGPSPSGEEALAHSGQVDHVERPRQLTRACARCGMSGWGWYAEALTAAQQGFTRPPRHSASNGSVNRIDHQMTLEAPRD